MTVSEFTNKAQQKIADLGYKIVEDLEAQNSHEEELKLLIDLYEFIENLNEPLNDWTDHFKNKVMDYYVELANLSMYAPVTFYGYTYNIGEAGATVIYVNTGGTSVSSIDIVDGYLIITYTDNSTHNAGKVGVGASIFVVDVEAVTLNKSVQIFYKTNTIDQDVVDYVLTDDTQLRIFIWWDGGKEWNGTMVANGLTVFENTDRISLQSRCFTADAIVDVDGLDQVVIDGNEGNVILPIEALPDVPDILSISFGGYPTTRGILQTELKDGDQIMVTLDLSDSSNVEAIIVENSAGFLDEEIVVSDIGNNQVQCLVTADHNYLTDTSKGIQLRLKTYTGSEGITHDSTGAAEVTMNNLHPDITFNSITYPASQSALKDSETADVDITVTDFDDIGYYPSGPDLSIPLDATYEQIKTVSRIGGQYNISSDNYSVWAFRNSNGSYSSLYVIVQIAHAVPQIDIVPDNSRLISGGADGTTAQDHIIIIYSDQKLASLPDLSASVATLLDDMFSNQGLTIFYETLQVQDSDAKGAGTFTISGTNLAGKAVTVINSGSEYVLGGFVKRRKFFAAFTNEVQMGVDVVDTTKLNAWDKDLIAMTYVSDQNDGVREYTIVNDDTIHWNDQSEVENNTTGLSFIEIEETP